MSKEIFERIGFSDILVSKSKRVPKYITIKDSDGNVIDETQAYLIGYELEDGTECDENGSEL